MNAGLDYECVMSLTGGYCPALWVCADCGVCYASAGSLLSARGEGGRGEGSVVKHCCAALALSDLSAPPSLCDAGVPITLAYIAAAPIVVSFEDGRGWGIGSY